MGDNESSYPALEYIWSNAVRVARATHSNLQDEIEYIEDNLGGGGNISCNCSELEYKIENLSDIKLSRDGSQPMTGLLTCQGGLKTNVISPISSGPLDCQGALKIGIVLGGDSWFGLIMKSDFDHKAPRIALYPFDSNEDGKIEIKTPTSEGTAFPRIEIPGKSDFVDIKIREANLIPYDDNYQRLGSSDKRWQDIHAVKGYFSYIEMQSRIWSNNTLKIGNGTISGDRTRIIFSPSDIRLLTSDSGGTLTERMILTGNVDNSIIYIKNTNIVPYASSYYYLGSYARRWARVYADRGYFGSVVLPDAVLTNSANISDLDERVDYLEANLSACNCSALQFGVNSNTTKIENLSTIKLSRDGSQPMTGTLTCQEGLKTDTIDTVSEDTITCEKDVIVKSNIWGGSTLTIGSGEGFIEAYPHIKFMEHDLILITPGESGPLERIYIYGGWDDSEIIIKNADLAPLTDNRRDLGFPQHTWRCVYAAKGNFSGTIVPDAILTNSANISDLDARVDYLEENLSTCNCSALQFGIDSNTTKINNLSMIKLSRDGSQTMTGLLKCASGLKTNTISSYSGDIVECNNDFRVNENIIGNSNDGLNLKAEDTSDAAIIQLTPGTNSKILLGTTTGQHVVVPRMEIPSGTGNVDVAFINANVIPNINNWQNLGNSDRKWKNIYAIKGYFSSIELQSRIWSNNTLTIGNGTSSGDLTQIIFTSTDISLRTPDSGNVLTDRISLTGGVDDSIVYIKNAHLLPYDTLSSYLGSTAHKWMRVYADWGYFSNLKSPTSSVLNIEANVEVDQKLWGVHDLIIAGGDPSYGHAKIWLYNKNTSSYPGALRFLTTNESGNPVERLGITGDQNIATLYINKAHLEPYYDNSYRLGSSIYRWSDIYAVNTHWGDLGFIENKCPKCNKKFKIGDNIVLKVVRFSEEDGGIMTIPIHLECAKLPTITIKKKLPVKEKYYEWDERQGKVVTKWRTKKQKKKIKKKRLKSGYKINQRTGEIEAANRKKINLSEAIEEIEEEIEEIVYQEKEIKI